jgi:hypothetical protein
MALQVMFGWDCHEGEAGDAMFDAVTQRWSLGSPRFGRYYGDGLVAANACRLSDNTGFWIHLAYFDLTAPSDEIIIAADIRPYSEVWPAGALWLGEFLEAGFGAGPIINPWGGVGWLSHERKFIAAVDGATGALKFYYGRTDQNFDWATWGGPTVLLGQTAPGVLTYGMDWTHLEFLLNLTTDSITVRQDGVQIFSANGVGMGGGVFNRVGYSHNMLGNDGPLIDNFYALDTTAGLRTTYLNPPARTCTYMPDTDAGPNNWTPSAPGNHFAMVDDLDMAAPEPVNTAMPDEDLTYNESAVAGQREMYLFTPTIPGITTAGLQFFGYFKAMGGVDATVNLVATSPLGVDYVYGPFTIPTGFAYNLFTYLGVRSPVLELDPESGLNWDDASLALWKFGYENDGGTQVRCTQLWVSKLVAPVAPPPAPPPPPMPPPGTGGSNVPYLASCGAPPTEADLCLMALSDVMWAVNHSAVCRSDPPPWREMPESGKRFQRVESLLLPAMENLDYLVLEWDVPTGYDGVITALSNFFTGSGYVNGSGDLIWRLKIDDHWVKDLDAIDVTIGRPSYPMKIRGAAYRIQSHQKIRYYVQLGPGALAHLNPTGYVVCGNFGWLYPRLGQEKQRCV